MNIKTEPTPETIWEKVENMDDETREVLKGVGVLGLYIVLMYGSFKFNNWMMRRLIRKVLTDEGLV